MDLFDLFVSSAEEGVRKPDAGIFRILLRRLDLESSAIVFVDDAQENVEAARSLGFHTVKHVSTTRTIHELEQFIHGGVPLA